jgi:hypothetical protein
MDPQNGTVSFSLVLAMTLFVMLAVFVALRLGRLRATPGLNETDDWMPGPDDHPKTPTLTPLTPYDRKLISAHLEPGETLAGFARGFFVPARPRDYKFGTGLEKLPLLVAATSRRILLFEVKLLKVYRTRFVPYDEVAFIEPPKPGLFGTSGKMKVGLRSGRAYQFGFLGPVLNAEGMRQEQQMAEHFRRMSVRIGTRSAAGSTEPRVAA